MSPDMNSTAELPAQVLGARVRAARREANLTMRQVGVALGVSTAMVCNYESGHSRMPLPRLLNFVGTLGIPLDTLLVPAPTPAALTTDMQGAPWATELAALLRLVDRPAVQEAMVRLVQSVAAAAAMPGAMPAPGGPSPRVRQRRAARPTRALPPAMPMQPREPAAAAEALLAGELQADMVRSGAGLRLHYQPLVNAGTGALEGFEALIRWTTAADLAMPALEVIGLASRHGFAEALDFWVMQEACTDAASWPPQAGPLHIFVNVTGALLASHDCVGAVRALLRGSRVEPRQLCIEVTETVLLDDQAMDNLRALRALGLRLAIDDFGTGHSSLARLLDLKVDVVKLDRSFFLERHLDTEALAFLQAMVAMAQRRGCQVVAEGIASAQDAALAREIGCDACQGFWYAEPMTTESVRALLATRGAAWVPRPRSR